MIEKTDHHPSTAGLTRKWALVALACAAPAFFLFAYFGEPGRGRAAAISIGMMVIAVRACWNLSRSAWFWITVGILACCHVVLISVISWTSRSYPGYALLPVAILDFAFIYGVIRLVDKAVKTRAS